MACLSLLCWSGLSAAAATSLCSALPPDAMVEEQQGYRVAVQFQPTQLQVGQLHTLSIQACDNEQPYVGSLHATAIMPAHNHGMNYRPRFTMSAPGQYLGTGFLFHMPGAWQLQITLVTASGRQHFTYDLAL